MEGAIVTGANGFIGSHVVAFLLKKGIRVAALCHNGKRNHLPQSDLLTVYPYDLSKVEDVVNLFPPPKTFAMTRFTTLRGREQQVHCVQIPPCSCRMHSGLLMH